MSHDHDRASPGALPSASPVPASRAGAGSTSARLPVQRRSSVSPASRPGALPFLDVQLASDAARAAAAGDADPAAVSATAARGLDGPGQTLPHGDRIQAAFGPHDVGGVTAHVGGAAAEASAALGAHGYATGDHVAFAGAPDLHLAAHEAAHVVQQRAGVHLAGAVGQAGDAYEQHADRVADAVVAGRPAAPILDELAGGDGRGGGGGGGAVQRKEDASDWMTDMIDPEVMFPQMDVAQRRRLLRGEHKAKEQARLLQKLPPAAAHEHLFGGEDAFIGVDGAQLLVILDRLPGVVAMLAPDEARGALTELHHLPEARRIFARLPFAVQVATFPQLPAQVRGEVWPLDGSVELKAALLGMLADHQLQQLAPRLSADALQDIVDYLPPHVVGRVRRACRSQGLAPSIVGTDAPASPAGASGDDAGDGASAGAARDVDAHADTLEADSEAYAAATHKPARVSREVSGDVPEADDWAEMPRLARAGAFKVAPMGKRVAYLARERESKWELLTELRDPRDRAETMAAWLRQYAWAAERLVGDAEPADLVAAIRLLGDPADAAAVFVAVLRRPQCVPILLAVMEPREIAAAVAQVPDRHMPLLWEALARDTAAANVTAVLRRLDDDQLARVALHSNEPEAVARLTPPERRAALGAWATAAAAAPAPVT